MRRPALLAALAGSVIASLLGSAAPGAAAGLAMRAPQAPIALRAPAASPETSSVSLALLGLVRLYQTRVSPLTTGRCGFVPSCSAYGVQAIRALGPVRGVVLIGDRLTRCNLFKREGPDYLLLSNGRLLDPLSANLPGAR